jgi:hypothetical protein
VKNHIVPAFFCQIGIPIFTTRISRIQMENSMTPEERQLLEGLFERIKTAAPNAPDKEAEEFIGKSMKDMPHAGYVLSQAVIVQEEALKAAVAKIEELEGYVQELEDKAQKAEANSGGFLGGIGKSLFGGSEPAPRDRQGSRDRQGYDDREGYDDRRSAVPSSRGPSSGISVPPRPGSGGGSPWNNQPGMAPGAMAGQQQAAGGGNTFLKGALGAAAGVAGGMLLANAVGGLFSGNNNPLGIGSAKASESKSSDSSSGDDWGDSKSSSSEGDDWKEDKNDSNTGDDWDNDNDTGDDWDDEGDDWDDDGGDDGDWE